MNPQMIDEQRMASTQEAARLRKILQERDDLFRERLESLTKKHECELRNVKDALRVTRNDLANARKELERKPSGSVEKLQSDLGKLEIQLEQARDCAKWHHANCSMALEEIKFAAEKWPWCAEGL